MDESAKTGNRPGCFGTVVALWLSVLTVAIVVGTQRDEAKLFTVWENGGLRIAPVHDGLWMVTHLHDVSGRSVAKLGEPIWIVESGGITIPAAELEKMEWVVPGLQFENARGERARAPKAGAGVRALSVVFESSRFVEETN